MGLQRVGHSRARMGPIHFCLFAFPFSFLPFRAFQNFHYFNGISLFQMSSELEESWWLFWSHYEWAWSPLSQPHPVSLPHSVFQTLSPPLILHIFCSLFSELFLASVGYSNLIFQSLVFWFFLGGVHLSFIYYTIMTTLWDFNVLEAHLCLFFLYNQAQKSVQIVKKSLMIILSWLAVSYISSTSNTLNSAIFHPITALRPPSPGCPLHFLNRFNLDSFYAWCWT